MGLVMLVKIFDNYRQNNHFRHELLPYYRLKHCAEFEREQNISDPVLKSTDFKEIKGKDLPLSQSSEKFMIIESDEASCKVCGYFYTSKKGDSNYPVPRDMEFSILPEDWK